MARAEERRTAIAAADGTCPRCGGLRASHDRYCLECGLRLPTVDGRLAVDIARHRLGDNA